MLSNEDLCLELCSIIPQDQQDRVFNQSICDIEPEFLGFVNIYKALSEIIPLNFTVIDFGCGYNPQSFFFQKHKRFIAIDSFKGTERFLADRTEFYECSIIEYIDLHINDFNILETFAICSYVPNWGGDNITYVKQHFRNVFTFYPYSSEHIKLKR